MYKKWLCYYPRDLLHVGKLFLVLYICFLFFFFELLMLFVMHSCAPLLVFPPLINMLNQSCGNCELIKLMWKKVNDKILRTESEEPISRRVN